MRHHEGRHPRRHDPPPARHLVLARSAAQRRHCERLARQHGNTFLASPCDRDKAGRPIGGVASLHAPPRSSHSPQALTRAQGAPRDRPQAGGNAVSKLDDLPSCRRPPPAHGGHHGHLCMARHSNQGRRCRGGLEHTPRRRTHGCPQPRAGAHISGRGRGGRRPGRRAHRTLPSPVPRLQHRSTPPWRCRP